MPGLLTSLVVLALTSPLIWTLKPHRYRRSGWLAAIPPSAITLWLLTQLGPVSEGHFLVESYAWAPSIGLDLTLRLDGLALLFGLIITGIGAAVALYTGYYFEGSPRQGYFYSLLFLFMASMLGLVWSDNLFALFVFWEGTSITSYLLIAFNDDEYAARDGGRRALIVTGLGGLAMLAGLVLLGQDAGTYSISQILATPGLTDSSVYPTALALLLLGAFSKSAQFPFHFWLPGAMAAPTPASAYLHSATMVKAGIYLLARLHPALANDPRWFWSLLIIGGITMLLGAVSALRYYDMKALLAYATISQLGILTMLLAFSTSTAYIAVTVGILAHALYKGPLFLVAGIVDHATGSRDLRRLGNLWRPLPWVTVTAVLASLSMAGLPPFFGFLAKEYTIETDYQFAQAAASLAGWISLGAAVVAAAFFVAYSITLLWEAFFRRQANQPEASHVHHAPAFSFVLAPLALALLGTAMPFLLDPLSHYVIGPTVSSISGSAAKVHLSLWHGFTPVLMISLVAIGAGIVLFFLRGMVRRVLQSVPEQISGNYVFGVINEGTYEFAFRLTRSLQGRTLAAHATVTLLSAFVIVAFGLTQLDWSAVLALQLSDGLRLPEVIIASLAIAAAFVTVQARSRLGAIIRLGVVGITVTLFFIFFSAPDLALTQLLIEVLTLVLLVLVFYRVQADRLPAMPPQRRITNLLVSMAMGVFGFSLVLLNSQVQIGESITSYFLLNSAPAAHGGNVVNVILVDFRGFDTLGEITVLGIAALGGYALLNAPRLRSLRARLTATMEGSHRLPAAPPEEFPDKAPEEAHEA